MLILVFVKTEIREHFAVVTNSLGAGLMGIMVRSRTLGFLVGYY